MGCQVVSVYADQSSGVIGYPEPIINDLYNRNYCSGNLLKNVPSSHPYYVLGFNQSFAQARLFTYVLNGKEYFIYSAARFLVTMEIPTKKKGDTKVLIEGGTQRTLMHEDKIVGLDVNGKLCLTGTVGGRLILWDLEFYEQKVNIKLPQPSINISSISMSKDFIFCTDTQSPHNFVYCYDIRTCKLKATTLIPSYEPMLKGISWNNNHHITVASDGVWFMRYSQTGKDIEVVKGMFRIFPKTSMTCLSVVDETYVITGTVDGYVFLWAFYQCQKVLKVGDNCVSDMLLRGNKLILGNMGSNVRVYEYNIKKKKKLEDDQKENGQITEDFVSVTIDSYEKEPLQAIVVSKLDQSIYYAQTRSGLLYNKMIPSADYQNKMQYYKDMDKKFIQFQKDTMKYMYKNDIWFIKYSKPFFLIYKMETKGHPSTWKIQSRYISNATKYVDAQDSKLYCLIPQINKVCYAGSNKIYICEISDIDLNPDTKIDKLKQSVVLEFDQKGPNSSIIRGLTWFELKDRVYLKLYFEAEYSVMRWEGQKWLALMSQAHDKQVKNEIEVDGEIVKFEQRNHAHRWVNPNITAQMKDRLSFAQCVHEVDDMGTGEQGRMVSLGGSTALIK